MSVPIRTYIRVGDTLELVWITKRGKIVLIEYVSCPPQATIDAKRAQTDAIIAARDWDND